MPKAPTETRHLRNATPAPIVKWAGGKTQLLPELIPLVPSQFRAYHEPFVGGAALFFALRNSRSRFQATLYDMNADLLNCYAVVRDDLQSLLPVLRKHARKHSERYYYSIRETEPDPGHKVRRAARFVYLNKTCYNGLYRVNSDGKFNVPIGRYENPKILESSALQAARRALQGVTLVRSDFADVLARAKRGDFVYLDPPYYPVSRTSSFTGYVVGPRGRASFGPAEHQRLSEVYKELDRRGTLVMLSNSDSEYIRGLYRGYRTDGVLARRNINSNGKRRTGVTELVITNY